MVQWPRSPRSQPRKARLSSSVSSRSVLARRCSLDTATLEGWMTYASMPRARSQRASQNPSRPASKATQTRMILRPALVASSLQRSSSRSRATSSASIFFTGWRSMAGTIPATSQLAWLSSMTAMSVLSCSRVTRHRLKSFACGMGHSVGSVATIVPCPRRLPHRISDARVGYRIPEMRPGLSLSYSGRRTDRPHSV